MAILNLNGITVEEINRNSKNSYAANIVSGEIFSVACRHSKNGNILLAIEGKALDCRDFNGNSFAADGCILYNPPLTRWIVAECDNSDASIFVVNGAVSKTAPASKPSTDKVVSKEALLDEKQKLQAEFFSLSDADQKAATERLKNIEAALNA